MKKIKVFLTDREKRELAAAIKAEMDKGVLLSVRLVHDTINRILPVDRRRNIVSFSNVPWLKGMIASTPEQVPEVKKPEEGTPPQKEVAVDQTSELVNLLVSMISPIISRVVEGVVKEVMDATRQVAGEVAKSPSTFATYEAKDEKIPKRRVVVVGMLNKEAARLQTEFGEIFNLKVYNHNQSLHTLRHMLPNADVVLLSTDNCTHSAEDVIKARFIGTYHRIRGGYSSMRKELQSMIS